MLGCLQAWILIEHLLYMFHMHNFNVACCLLCSYMYDARYDLQQQQQPQQQQK